MKIFLIILLCLAFVPKDVWHKSTTKEQDAFMTKLAILYAIPNHCSRVSITWEEKDGFIEFEATNCEMDI